MNVDKIEKMASLIFEVEVIQQMNIRQRFRQSLRCGTGEAYLILRANPKIDFSRDIAKAALTNYAYHSQYGSNRAVYVARLIDLSNRKDQLVEVVLKALAKERKDRHALGQLFELAAIFAKQGNVKARRAIYKKFQENVIKYDESIGEDALLNLDGIEGLKFVAEITGKALTKDPDDWEDSFLVDSFQKENPKVKVYDELKKAAKDNPFINKYLETIKKHKWTEPKAKKRSRFNYKFVKDRIENSQLPILGVVRELTKAEIKKLADDFLQEKDAIKKGRYLSVFSGTKFPYDYQVLLQIAKGKSNRDNRLVEFACEALGLIEAKEIRQFAIKKLSKTNIPYYYLPLLAANYKKGDSRLLARIADKYKNEHIIHYFAYSYIDIYVANKTKECKKPLEIIYSKLTCGIHRRDILEILYENGVLSKKILKEMEFDSYEPVRDFYKEICDRN